MKKKKLWTLLALASTAVCLAACSAGGGSSKSDSGAKTEKTSEKDAVQKDAEVLLNAVLTKDDNGFKRLYGSSYNTWTEDEVFPSQIDSQIEKNGWTPEEDYTLAYIKGGDQLTPSDVLERFLETRRDDYKDVGEYTIKEVTINKDKASVTIESRHLNGMAMANAISNIQLALAGGNLDVFGALKEANEADGEFKKQMSLFNFFLYYGNFSGLFIQYDDVPVDLEKTVLTEGVYEVTFDLTKDKEGHWLISEEDYKTLMGDLWNETETADQGTYAGEEESDNSTSSSSSEEKETDTSSSSTKKSAA